MPDSRIQALAKRIAETRPIERAKQQALQEELRLLRASLDPRAGREPAQRLDAALLLLEFMGRSEDVATADTLQTVAGLVASVDERALGRSGAASGPRSLVARTPTGDVSQHSDLRLTEELLLGTILLQAGVLSQESLTRALRLHASSGIALGQCLLQLGAATPAQIASAVAYQDRAREGERAARQGPEKPAPARASAPATRLDLRLSPKQKGFVQSFHAQVLGEVLIRLGAITREQLERALHVQRAADLHIGEALVETGATSWEQIKKGLEVQRQLRRSAA